MVQFETDKIITLTVVSFVGLLTHLWAALTHTWHNHRQRDTFTSMFASLVLNQNGFKHTRRQWKRRKKNWVIPHQNDNHGHSQHSSEWCDARNVASFLFIDMCISFFIHSNTYMHSFLCVPFFSSLSTEQFRNLHYECDDLKMIEHRHSHTKREYEANVPTEIEIESSILNWTWKKKKYSRTTLLLQSMS